MEPRLDHASRSPGAMRAMLGLERHVRASGLEPGLIHLIKLRASQMNGCAFCVDMHAKDARADGESDQRLVMVSVWREAPSFTPRERAALAWTEALTDVRAHGVPDELFREVREHFTEGHLVDLTLAVVAINGWNRINSAFRPEVGPYQPGAWAEN